VTDITSSESPKVEQPQKTVAPPITEPAKKPGIAGRIARFLLRMLVVVVLGIVLGAGLFYGTIDLYRNTIEPLRTVDSRLSELEAKLELQNESTQAQVGALQDRAAELEGSATASGETISEMEAQIGTLQLELEQQNDQITAFKVITDRLASLTQDLSALSERVNGIEGVLASADLPTQRILRDLQLLRAMTLLTRARVSLNQVNLGLAQVDMLAARDILVAVQPGTDETPIPADAPSLRAALERLDSALVSVLTNQALAGEELEICWQYLITITAPPSELPVDGAAE